MSATKARPPKHLRSGFARFECATHGFLVDTFTSALVWCRCGKKAKPA